MSLEATWKKETVERVGTILAELRFKKAMVSAPGDDPDKDQLTTWLHDAILLVEHLQSDLEDL